MARRIRWAFWGVGAEADAVAADFAFVPDAELYAVAAWTQTHAERFAAQHAIPKCVANLESLLDDPAVDIVYISTPHYRHLEDSLDTLAAGKPLLCEKPFTLNALQAAQVIDAARDQDLFCMAASWARFMPAVVELKRRVAAGEIGAVRLLTANLATPEYFDPDSRFFSLDECGGALLDRGVETIDFACHLLGLPQSISSSAALGRSGVDDQSTYQLAFDDGALADLSASLRVLGTNEAVVMGEHGQIRLHAPFQRACRFTIRRFESPESSAARSDPTETGFAGRLKTTFKHHAGMQQLRQRIDPVLGLLGGDTVHKAFPGNGHQFQIAEATRCLREGLRESPVMPLDETLAIMQIMDAIRGQWGLVYPGE